MKWEIGLSTGIAYRHPILGTLAPIAAGGFKSIEVSTSPHHFHFDRAEAVAHARKRIDELGLRVVSLHAPFGPEIDVTSTRPAVRRKTLERLDHAADALSALGGRFFVIHPGSEDSRWSWDRDGNLARAADALRHVHESCRSRGILLTVETPLPHLLGGALDDLSWILSQLPSEGTGVCLDTSHTSLGGLLYQAIERFGPRLVHIQASDNRGVYDDHLPPGAGKIDWRAFLAALKGIDYQGALLLEITGDGDVGPNVRASAEAARWLRELDPA